MLRSRRNKKNDSQNSANFSYSKAESSVKSDSQEESVVLSNNLDLEVDEKSNPWSEDDKKIFEQQLEALQDQLFASMIENQKLAEQVQVLKEEDAAEQLHQEKKELQAKLNKLEKVLHSLNTDRRNHTSGGADVNMDEYEIVRTAEVETEQSPQNSSSPDETHWLHPVSLYRRVRKKSLDFLSDFVNDHDEDGELVVHEKTVPSLSYKRLKENCQRVGTSSKPLRSTISSMLQILRWKNIPLSLLIFVLYMYSVWLGWLLQAVLFYAIVYLSVNYLKASGLASQFGFVLTDKKAKSEMVGGSTFDSLGLSDKVQVAKKVAHTVQDICHNVADVLEKIQNLFMWREPDATLKLYKTLCSFFVISLFVPNNYMFTAIGLGMGFKLFVMDQIYRKYPKVQARYDTVAKVWATLPTNAEVEERQSLTHVQLQERIQALTEPAASINFVDSDVTANMTEEDVSFCERFTLPANERPLPDWQGGKRCIMIDKDRPLLGAKQGKLYLTQGFICFERSQKSTQRMTDHRFSLSLKDTEAIIPCKPLAVMPGSGMAISIKLKGIDKPHIFGALLNRDEVLKRILFHGSRSNYSWATVPLSDSTPLND